MLCVVLEWQPTTNLENTRFLIVLTLAEAETVRRIIHTQKFAKILDPNNPLLHHVSCALDNKVQMALRIVSGHVLDTTKDYTEFDAIPGKPGSRDQVVATGMQCLRFFNNEMFYTPEELALVMNALCMCNPDDRRDFFEECLRRRRRERMLWEVTPVAKVFTTENKWDLLRSQALVRLAKDQLRINFTWARKEKFALNSKKLQAEKAIADQINEKV